MKGDVKFAEVLEKMGAEVTWTENSVTVKGPPRDAFGRKHLKAIDINMNKMPDVAMTLAVVALFADGPTAIRDGTDAFTAVMKRFSCLASFNMIMIRITMKAILISYNHVHRFCPNSTDTASSAAL